MAVRGPGELEDDLGGWFDVFFNIGLDDERFR
jgi:hypothetical protein